jgi:hypothetical protein
VSVGEVYASSREAAERALTVRAQMESAGERMGAPPAAQAQWENGVRQLLGVGLIEPQGDRVFCITPEGYQAADVLQRHK